jgi:hypothetical protein
MKLLIIGFGSIGARHARLAQELGHEIACVTANQDCPYPKFASIESACANWQPERVLIANVTDKHLDSLIQLDQAGYKGFILIEKPLFDQMSNYQPNHPEQIFVAYNLRFHPLLKLLKEHLADRTIYSAEFHVGQYLPDWRPGTDYRLSYSAQAKQGGGVLRDLSHEIDLAFWICGEPESVVATGGQLSDLEITSDDVFLALVKTKKCHAVSISLNYLNRTPQRLIRINAKGMTLTLDLIAGKLEVNGEVFESHPERDFNYNEQLIHFMNCHKNVLCSYQDGKKIMEFIVKSEIAIETNSWQSISV